MMSPKDVIANKTKHQLQHAFTWPVPLDMAEITPDELFAMRLVKGVAMSEGELKSGDLMSRDNVIAGGGAMRASAIMGNAQLDIDHFETELPPSYKEKYGAEIADPYPPGLIVDAQAVENHIEGKNVMQVEFIAIIKNQKVYDMIKQGLFKGCSVVDYNRGLTCTDKCSYQGSAYLSNTLILDEVPNSQSTWVAAVDEHDIGTIIKPLTASTDLVAVNTNPGKLHKLITTHMASVAKKPQGKPSLHNLENYMTEGMWNHGITSAQEYLVQEKEIDHDTANAMASYLMENPDNVSQYQLENLSHEDMMAWWSSTGLWFKRFNDLTKTVGELRWLARDNIAQLQKTTQSFTKDQVRYHSASGEESCNGCKWYVSHNFDRRDEKGHCKIVHGEVRGNQVCERYAKHVSKQCGCDVNKDLDEEQKGIIDDIKDVVEDIPGMEIVEPAPHADPVPVDGKCPDGWMISEDGTACTKPMAVPEHTQHKARIEADPVQDENLKIAALNAEIERHSKKRDVLRRQLAITPVMHSARLSAEYNNVVDEIARLIQLKKKSS